MPLSPNGMRTIMRQLREIHAKPVDCIAVLPADDLSEVRFELDGPEGTPFREGRFLVSLQFDEQYPEVPPKGYFRTPIFHPNVAPETGDICVNALKRDWDPSMGLRHILVVIRCLLVEPNAESALNEVAGRLILEDYIAYERQALMMTRVHAKRPAGVRRHHVEDSSSSSHNNNTSSPAASACDPDGDGSRDGKKKMKKEEDGDGASFAGSNPVVRVVAVPLSEGGVEGGEPLSKAEATTTRLSQGSSSSQETGFPLSSTTRVLGSATASGSEGVVDVPAFMNTTSTCSSLENTCRGAPQEAISAPSSTTAGLRNVDHNTSTGLSNAERAKKRAAEKRKSALRRI